MDISWYRACAVQHVCLLFAVWYVNGELNMLILLKEIFDKLDNIFWKHTSMLCFCYENFFMRKIVQNCKG